MLPDFLSASSSTFLLIALAELGDKSQLVCMTLAARHRATPVICGAGAAFLLLNGMAVAFGAAIASWMPVWLVSALAAVLFAGFGFHALLSSVQADPEVVERQGRSVFVATFLLILVAEFGDKTQLAVAGLAVSLPASAVWWGASVALLTISALGVWAGRTILQRIPLQWLHRLSGSLFLLFAGYAGWKSISGLMAV